MSIVGELATQADYHPDAYQQLDTLVSTIAGQVDSSTPWWYSDDTLGGCVSRNLGLICGKLLTDLRRQVQRCLWMLTFPESDWPSFDSNPPDWERGPNVGSVLSPVLRHSVTFSESSFEFELRFCIELVLQYLKLELLTKRGYRLEDGWYVKPGKDGPPLT